MIGREDLEAGGIGSDARVEDGGVGENVVQRLAHVVKHREIADHHDGGGEAGDAHRDAEDQREGAGGIAEMVEDFEQEAVEWEELEEPAEDQVEFIIAAADRGTDVDAEKHFSGRADVEEVEEGITLSQRHADQRAGEADGEVPGEEGGGEGAADDDGGKDREIDRGSEEAGAIGDAPVH